MQGEHSKLTTEAIVNKEDIETIKNYFLQSNRIRDYALFSLGINLGINVSRLIALRWCDVYDFQANKFFDSISVRNKRNAREMKVALNESCKDALGKFFKSKNDAPTPEGWIFESRDGGPITRFRAFQIIKRACVRLGIEGNIGCQSMKKTLVYYAYKEGTRPEFFAGVCTNTDIKEMRRYRQTALECERAYVPPNL